MAAAVASHLVKVEPQNAAWWINLAYALRRTESVEKAEAILLQAQAIHPKVAMIAFNLACYASVTGRMEEAKERLRHAIKLDKDYALTLLREVLCKIPQLLRNRIKSTCHPHLLAARRQGVDCQQGSGLEPKQHISRIQCLPNSPFAGRLLSQLAAAQRS